MAYYNPQMQQVFVQNPNLPAYPPTVPGIQGFPQPFITQPIITHPILAQPVIPVRQVQLRPALVADLDAMIDSSDLAQRDITKYYKYKVLDKWLYGDMAFLLKYLKVSNGQVVLVKTKKEYEANDVSKDSSDVIEKKADYIETNILTNDNVRMVLKRTLSELMIKWYELPNRENLVHDVLEGFIRKELKKHLTEQ